MLFFSFFEACLIRRLLKNYVMQQWRKTRNFSDMISGHYFRETDHSGLSVYYACVVVESCASIFLLRFRTGGCHFIWYYIFDNYRNLTPSPSPSHGYVIYPFLIQIIGVIQSSFAWSKWNLYFKWQFFEIPSWGEPFSFTSLNYFLPTITFQ